MSGISICIPTYNRLPHLKNLLESIFKGFGDYPYEIIIADGGSTDGTIEYLKNFNNIVLIQQEKLMGSVRAYNVCFKLAKHQYIFWPADDFILVPEVLIKACQLMDAHKEIAMVVPKMEEPTFGNIQIVDLFADFSVLSKTHIFRASVLREINYFDENFRTYGIDEDSGLAILNLGYNIIFTKEVGIIHNRVQDKLRAHNQDEQRRESEYLRKKWAPLNLRLNQHLALSPLGKYKLKFIQLLCKGIFELKLFRLVPEKSRRLAGEWYNRLLEECAVFKAEEYQNLKDFYLAQRLPKEVLK